MEFFYGLAAQRYALSVIVAVNAICRTAGATSGNR